MCLKGFCWSLSTTPTKARYKMENVILFVCFAWSTEDGGADCCFRRTETFFFYSGVYYFVKTVIKSIWNFSSPVCVMGMFCSKDTDTGLWVSLKKMLVMDTALYEGRGVWVLWVPCDACPGGRILNSHFILFLCTWLTWKEKQDELSSLKYWLFCLLKVESRVV